MTPPSAIRKAMDDTRTFTVIGDQKSEQGATPVRRARANTEPIHIHFERLFRPLRDFLLVRLLLVPGTAGLGALCALLAAVHIICSSGIEVPDF